MWLGLRATMWIGTIGALAGAVLPCRIRDPVAPRRSGGGDGYDRRTFVASRLRPEEPPRPRHHLKEPNPMNKRPIHHVCYIVDDIPQAVDQWVEATGAGPFFHLGEHVEFEETLLNGDPCVFDHASAIGKWGPILLELMKLHELSPELESRVGTAGAGGSKVSHIAYTVDDPAAESERLESLGMRKFLHLRTGPIQISLHDAPLLGHAIEVHENIDAINGLFALIAAAAEGWDGSEPLRAMPQG
jgi:catechol 2,3-dioxygenase-like lactoylglutathione lyase family enzyme